MDGEEANVHVAARADKTLPNVKATLVKQGIYACLRLSFLLRIAERVLLTRSPGERGRKIMIILLLSTRPFV
jgi:hypothetical protein